MTWLTRLINDLSKAHITSLGQVCGHSHMQREAGIRESSECESRMSRLQMASLTGVIIIGNYTTLVIL